MLGMLGAVWGALNPGNFVVVDRALDHPLASALTVTTALIVLIGWTVPTLWIRASLMTLLSAAVCALAYVAFVFTLFGGSSHGSFHASTPSPDGRITAEIREFPGFADDEYRVVLTADSGILAREATIARTGEVPPDISFRDDTTVVLTTGTSDYIVRFDASTLEVMSAICQEDTRPSTSAVAFTSSCPWP